MGTNSDYVTAWQQLLNDQGFNVVVDGVFGAETETATTQFQRRELISVDGVVGQQTISAMGKYYDMFDIPSNAGSIQNPQNILDMVNRIVGVKQAPESSTASMSLLHWLALGGIVWYATKPKKRGRKK